VKGKSEDPIPNQESPSSRPPYLQWVALGLILLLGAGLRIWNLDQNGYGTEYYAAGVRSMMNNWHNFFYNAFDPAGFVSLDKPPVALWIQVASAKLFGFSGFSLILPQVLEGLGCIVLVYAIVRPYFGTSSGLLSAFFLALTPVAVATDRSNNTDSCLVLVLLLAAWVLLRASQEGRRFRLILSMALIGVGFNVKMLAAFVVLPTFVLVYWLGSPLAIKRRIFDLILSSLVLIIISLSWVLFYDLTPPERRPYVGSTKGNSMFELTIGHNALGRFIRRDRALKASGVVAKDEARDRQREKTFARDPRMAERWSKIFVKVPVGPLRLADRQMAGQVAWLFPLAFLGLAAAWLRSSLSFPLNGKPLSLVLWAGWALTFGIVYSFAGGIFHFYYLATLGPPLAALAGIGLVSLWSGYLENRRSWLLPAALLLTVVWQIYIQFPYLNRNMDFFNGGGPWISWLFLLVISGVAASVIGLSFFPSGRSEIPRRPLLFSKIMAGIGVFSLLLFPGAWALSSVLARDVAMLPSADFSRLVKGKDQTEQRSEDRAERKRRFRKLVVFLKTHNQGERFLLATSSARLAAPIIVRTGDPVLAMGGFHGLDPILTPETLAQMVKEKKVRFVMLGDFSLSGRIMGAEKAEKPLAEWVREKGRPVDPALWGLSAQDRADQGIKTTGSGERAASRLSDGGYGSLQLYDLRPSPETAQVPPGEE
jgi:4-amino-4-deoxy-L-arabinose transferase-like glycosyltransferase